MGVECYFYVIKMNCNYSGCIVFGDDWFFLSFYIYNVVLLLVNFEIVLWENGVLQQLVKVSLDGVGVFESSNLFFSKI